MMERTHTHATSMDRLSEYLDGDLTSAEAEGVERHLEECDECRGTLGELRQVAERARRLPDVPPDRDLWGGIAAEIGGRERPLARVAPSGPPKRFSFTLPQLVAAGLALMLLSGGMVWLARLGGDPTDFPQVAASDAADAPAGAVPVTFADAHFDEAIADLQQTLDAERDKLDPTTVRVLEENLASIDRAIEQCRQALAGDPANLYLADRLVAAQKKKLTVLRRANAIARSAGI